MFDERELLKKAYLVAAELSTDPSTQNGALLVTSQGEVLAQEANHLPLGVLSKEERWQRPQKYYYVEHAERNVIFQAAKKGIATEKMIMVVPWFACADCGRAIIQAGIRKVVGHQDVMDRTPDHWKDSIHAAMNMLQEAGVECSWYAGNVGDGKISIRFNGGLIFP